MLWILLLCIVAYELYIHGKEFWPSNEVYYKSCLKKIEQAAANGKTSTFLYFMSWYPAVEAQLDKDGLDCRVRIMHSFYSASWENVSDQSKFGYKFQRMAVEKQKEFDALNETKFKKVRETL